MRPDLSQCIPGKAADECKQDDCAGTVGERGEGVRDYLADVLQAHCEALLPVRQGRHGAIRQPNPQHASSDKREQKPTGQVRGGQRPPQGTEPPGERAQAEEAGHSPPKALPEEPKTRKRGRPTQPQGGPPPLRTPQTARYPSTGRA